MLVKALTLQHPILKITYTLSKRLLQSKIFNSDHFWLGLKFSEVQRSSKRFLHFLEMVNGGALISTTTSASCRYVQCRW